MKPVTLKFPQRDIKRIDKILESGDFESRSDFIRSAVQDMLGRKEKERADREIVENVRRTMK